jgi:hypothetical protein
MSSCRFARWAPLVCFLAFPPVALLSAQAAKPVKDTVPATDPKVWVNYDFVPGNRVIFFTDYADDQVGNFPKRLAFKLGNMEVAEVDGQRFLRVTSHSVFVIPLTEVLPPKFTIEIDVINRKGLDGPAFQMQGTLLPSRDGKTSTIAWGSGGVGLAGGGSDVPYTYEEATRTRYRGKPAQLRVLTKPFMTRSRRRVESPLRGFCSTPAATGSGRSRRRRSRRSAQCCRRTPS